MKAYQQRVVDEKSALDENIGKLNAFLNSETRTPIDPEEHNRMQIQEKVMHVYSHILGGRIAAFK